jgi:hypothetical protein
MDLVLVALAIAAFVLLLASAALLPLFERAALGPDAIDRFDRATGADSPARAAASGAALAA